MQDFRNLGTWQKAHALVLRIYRETQALPREEIFGVTMQLRRSSMAVATRLAEGCGKESDAEFAVDLRKAGAICNDVEYVLLLAGDLGLLQKETSQDLIHETVEVRKMIYGLLKKF